MARSAGHCRHSGQGWQAPFWSASVMRSPHAYALDIPLVGVSHPEGHIASYWINRPAFPRLRNSSLRRGHTHLFHAEEKGGFHLMGRTIDDAAGEALIRGRRCWSGYPGGPLIDAAAERPSHSRAISALSRENRSVRF